ncbi:MAG: hypothetical protein WD227_02980, partial [Vicinamibacterales bacterium]
MSRSVMVALLVAGGLTAAAGGSYLAVRQNAASASVPSATVPAQPAATPGVPVQETEGVIEAPRPEPPAAPALEPETPAAPRAPEMRRRQVPAPTRAARPAVMRASEERAAPVEGGRPAVPETPMTAIPTPETSPREERLVPVTEYPAEPQPVEPVIEEVVIPASAVIGLEIETTVSSERARVEDRVDARVTRDVFAGGRLVLPAGSRVTGAVMLVERGGKVKERARLGVRFHTVALANGRQVLLRTEPIYRDGESPAAESSRKIGGAAVGGAVLGAILGGGKGAIAGATAGAAGGTAAVMSGGRNPAVLAAGSIVTVKLASPAYV